MLIVRFRCADGSGDEGEFEEQSRKRGNATNADSALK